MTVYSALGNGWDLIGTALTKSGEEDSSGARRQLVEYLGKKNYRQVTSWLKISQEEAEKLREDLVSIWGEPE